MIRTFLACILSLTLAAPALAHRVNVFASVQDVDGTEFVVVEARFSTGRIPVSGDVTVEDAQGEELFVVALESDGTARFPLDREVASDGLSIVVQTGDNHEGYWLLTPADLGEEN
ncbi:hypothetical protein [Pontivivens insulae]|uniref:Nickel transport protein n=1 Tax=Pontivivens insulae TaxID=1639689 RepID=A0A2R8A8Y4_9RHOB|nr:hypothetical protein [Pontivivens insulae]RED18781.1 nickel transport protein [Pontivivens insulae]SPF28679.1 hypothetical protein POI8812_00982 [Pontivivens insulae]